MRKIFAFLISALIIAVACTPPDFDDGLNNDLKENVNGTEGSDDTSTPGLECANNEIHYVTSDGKPLIPNKLGIATFGANLVSNNSENGIGTLVFDKDITKIGDNAFSNYSTLVSIVIPNSVTSIGKETFYNCTGLTSVTIGNGVRSIEKNAFLGCSALKEVLINDLEAWCNIDFYSSNANPLYCAKNLYLNGELVTNLVIPDGVTSIGNSAFEGCSGLTNVTIPNSVTNIEGGAFYYCI